MRMALGLKGAVLRNRAKGMPLVPRYEARRVKQKDLASPTQGSDRGESMLGPAQGLHNRIYFCKARA